MPDARPCGPARTDKLLPAAQVHSMVVARGHRPTAVRFSFVRGPDRAPGSACRQRTDDRRQKRSCTMLMQSFEPPASAADPSGQRRTGEIDAVAGKDLRLPIKRRVIAIFADQYLGEQRRRRQSAGDQPFRRRRLHHRLTDRQAYFGRVVRTTRSCAGTQSSISLTLSPIRMQCSTAARPQISLGDVEHDVFARQMIGQGFALGLRLGTASVY